MNISLNVFRFNANFDYNDYYQKLDLNINEDSAITDLLQILASKLRDFDYSNDLFFKINSKIIAKNLTIGEIIGNFGNKLTIEPLSIKYAKKDLLLNNDALFGARKEILDSFTFLSEEMKLEYKKYAFLNLISPLSQDDYIGDGFAIYIKHILPHYKQHESELLSSIFGQNGILNSIKTSDLFFPNDDFIDSEIEFLTQLQFKNPNPFNYKIIRSVAKKYHKIGKAL